VPVRGFPDGPQARISREARYQRHPLLDDPSADPHSSSFEGFIRLARPSPCLLPGHQQRALKDDSTCPCEPPSSSSALYGETPSRLVSLCAFVSTSSRPEWKWIAVSCSPERPSGGPAAWTRIITPMVARPTIGD
jgi:hypothetical protein